jgi:hypothetical protein
MTQYQVITLIISILSIVFSAGVLIGGYKFIVGDIKSLKTKVEKLIEDVATIKGYLEGKKI